jgi:peptidoglycan glycosyltransferase
VRSTRGVNESIARLGTVFALLFVVLVARQVWVQVVDGARVSANSHNPRASLLLPYRGTIVARDGTVLAHSTARGRVYPYGAALAQTLGYASIRYGTSGLEAAFDKELQGHAAASDPRTQLRGAFGAPDAGPIRGTTIVTTIEPRVQAALYDALSAYPRGAGVAIDPRTGEVLAIASVPSFDPAAIDKNFATISADSRSPLLNRAIAGLYPPGSSFKIVTAADALDAGVVTPESVFVDRGTYKVGSFLVHDDSGESNGTGRQDLAGAFALSSNVDFAQIALGVDAERWFQYAARWRLGESLGFTLPAERDHLPVPDTVSDSILAQLGYGQADLTVTPMRMALIGSTIASGGTEPHPYLVRSIRSHDGRERSLAPGAPLAVPLTPEVADQVRSLMLAVVERGTGTAAALPGIRVAGKTGTATIATGRAHAWFVAFAPADAPRVAVAIVVENAGYGGSVAAPIARRVLSVALSRITK